jgi:hypothetical protein
VAVVYPAAGFLLGLLVPAGSHEVVFAYREPGVWWGAAIALVTLAILPRLLRRVTR